MHWTRENYQLTTDQNDFDFKAIHAFIGTSYWAENIPFDLMVKSINNSVSIGLFCTTGQKQIGFARCITDQATFAYLSDVYVLPDFRHQGLASWMLECLFSLDSLSDLRRISLVTADAHHLYQSLGFVNADENSGYMHKRILNPYV